MNIQILTVSPILVKIKYVGITLADVKMIVDAAGLGSRSVDETAQEFKKFGAFFWASVKSSCEGATWFHIFFLLPFDHARYVDAIWISSNKCISNSIPGLVEVSPIRENYGSAFERDLQ